MSLINYKVRGEGLPIILIHGFCESAEIWDSFTSQLPNDFQIISLDLPGFGKSELPRSPFGLDEIGAILNGWVLKQGLQNSIVIGHSLGGYVALAMVAQQEALYAGLGLFHSTAKPDNEMKRQNRTKVMDFIRANGVPAFVDSFVPGLYHIKDHPSIEFAHKIALNTSKSTFLAYTAAMRDRPSREEVLEKTKIPVLIIAGDNDPVVSVHSLEEQASLNQKISFFKLPNVGHMGMFEAQAAAAEIVNNFVYKVRSQLEP